MVHLIHDVLVILKDGTTQETSLTDQEAFNNLQAGLTITIGVFNGNFIFNGNSVPFKNLTSNTLRSLQEDNPNLQIQITSASTKSLETADIHEFEKLEDFIPPDEPPIIEPPVIEPNDEVNPTMVSQSIGAFQIIDNRVKGEILYIANNSFNSFWNDKPISSFVQIKDINNQVLVVKENKLHFSQTEREERILIDESAFKSNPVTIEFFVWVSLADNRAFADPKRITVEIGQPPPPDPPPIVAKDDTLFKVLKGLLFGAVAGTLLTSKGK